MTSPAFSTCDFCDAHKNDASGEFRVLAAPWHSYGGVAAFAGQVTTVKCYEDNTQVKAAVESPGQGRVLVVDGAGSLRRALVGGNLAAAAAHNGWEECDSCAHADSDLCESCEDADQYEPGDEQDSLKEPERIAAVVTAVRRAVPAPRW